MDNENGTAAVTTKVDEPKLDETATSKTDTMITETVKSADVSNLDEKLVEAAVKTDELKIRNTLNDVAVNKTTTTTVTVNVTQKKVTVDNVDKTHMALGDVVSSVSHIAEAALAEVVEKVEVLKPAEINSIEDIEMVEADTDCEMRDVSTEQPQVVTTTSAESSKPKISSADLVNSTAEPADQSAVVAASQHQEVVPESNEAEQKIDDVEKNISNLFNGGDDNVGSTNDKSLNVVSKSETPALAASSQNDSSLKNGGGGTTTASSMVANQSKSNSDAISDNNDLVSILAGNDSKPENISSSISASQKAQKAFAVSSNAVSNNVSEAIAAKPVEAGTKASISTVSEAAIDGGGGLGGKAARQEILSSHSSSSTTTTRDKAAADLSSTVTGSEASAAADNIDKDVQSINGLLADVTDASSSKKTPPVADKAAAEKESTVDSSVKATTTAPATPVTKAVQIFGVSICYDNSELVSFSVEKQDGSSASSANNSVPSSSDVSVSSQQEIKGTLALCQFVIDHFEKLRNKLAGHSQSTPATSGRRGRNSNVEPTTPSLTNTPSKRKRGSAAPETPAINESDEADAQPKSAKRAKKEPSTPKAANTPKAVEAPESNFPEKAVLARWVDKKFYAGRVIDQKPNNKFVVLFEDGAKKTLPDEHIVFGNDNILPLLNENVHAKVDGETYEPGLVQSTETKEDAVYYTVLCESTTVTVTASDIYLEEDQAKIILSKHATNNPEPGFSGGLSTRKDRRNKRAESNRHVQWFSESDVSDINESDSWPASPVTVLDAVDGVQPELQHTQKESELVRVCYLMERFGDDFKKVNLDSVLGPIVQSKILKNKSFLLTCTIPIKSTHGGTNGTHGTNGTSDRQNARFDLTNKHTVFSTVPFFKDHLKQQIEAAGGIVYSNFENIPTNKYRSCFLLSPFPCITAKYVQSLAANITAVSHDWIVESCQKNKLLQKEDYVLPSGWSIVENKYKPWSVGRGREERKNAFNKTTIILTSQQSDFVEFWSRVCKSAGAKIRLVKSTSDLTATTKGYILMDDEFPHEYQSRAERFNIPIVSTVWVIQSLILGKVCDPNAHPKLTQLYEDDYF